jgi:hypothetical protein
VRHWVVVLPAVVTGATDGVPRCYKRRPPELLTEDGGATSGGRQCYFRWAAVLLLVGGGATGGTASGSLGCCKVSGHLLRRR